MLWKKLEGQEEGGWKKLWRQLTNSQGRFFGMFFEGERPIFVGGGPRSETSQRTVRRWKFIARVETRTNCNMRRNNNRSLNLIMALYFDRVAARAGTSSEKMCFSFSRSEIDKTRSWKRFFFLNTFSLYLSRGGKTVSFMPRMEVNT